MQSYQPSLRLPRLCVHRLCARRPSGSHKVSRRHAVLTTNLRNVRLRDTPLHARSTV